MNDLKDEIAREYRMIARRWRLRSAVLYASVILALLLLAHFSETRKDEVAGLQKRWSSSIADRSP